MERIQSQLSTRSEAFRRNQGHHRDLAALLARRTAEVRAGGGERAQRRLAELGKLPVRERIEGLLDRGSPFLELSALAAWGMYGGEVPSAGIVCGIGRVHGREVMVVANDPTVKGGTYHPLTVKKHLRAQQIALENRLPCVYLVDSGGAFLPEQAQVFPDRFHFGRIFYHQARLSAAGIPQLAAVLGSCTAGGAYVPAMSDEAVIVKGQGTIFLAGPPLVRAATGEEVSAEELGGAEVHARRSGVVDHYAEDEQHALAILRGVIGCLNRPAKAALDAAAAEQPAYDPEEISGLLPIDLRQPYDVREVLARLVDGSRFAEFKRHYATTVVCGFARVHGMLVGLVANSGVLHVDSAEKATHFIELCGQRLIPLVFLQNITGFMVGRKAESAGIARAGAKMVHAVSTCGVPCLTVIVGGSYGAGNYAMCGRAFDPRFLWIWPNARTSVMGPEQAAEVLVTVKREQLTREGRVLEAEEERRIAGAILEKYQHEADAYFSTARLWDDGIVAPTETRDILALSLSAVLNAPIAGMRPGVFRM